MKHNKMVWLVAGTLMLALVAGLFWLAPGSSQPGADTTAPVIPPSASLTPVVFDTADLQTLAIPLDPANAAGTIPASTPFKQPPPSVEMSADELNAALLENTPKLAAAINERQRPATPPPPLRGIPYGSSERYIDPATQALFEETLRMLGEDAEWRINAADGTLQHLYGPLENLLNDDPIFARAKAEGNTTLVARRTLQKLAPLMNIRDPDAEFDVVAAETDAIGMTHLRMQQMLDGLEVFGAEALVHLNAENNPVQVNGVYAPSVEPFTLAADIGPDAALDAARKAVNADEVDLVEPIVKKIYYWRPGIQPRKAYQVDISPAIDASWHVFIDITDGSPIHVLSAMATVARTGTALDLSNVSRTVYCWQDGAQYFACDTTIAAMYDPASQPPDISKTKGVIAIITVGGRDYIEAFQQNQVQWVTSANVNTWDPRAVSVQHNFRLSEQYYRATHGRNSIDNKGMNIVGCIDAKFRTPGGGLSGDNACWHPGVQMMFFGDGDQSFINMPKSLDVTAHELTHGVVSHTANLKYEFQSGALNEHYADFFAAMVDREGNNWLIGEGIIRVPGKIALRDMSDPHNPNILDQLPKTMAEYKNLPIEQDQGGVHINVGIPSYASYLMTDGLPNPLGKVKAENIHYRALTTYLTQYSQFNDFRAALISSARDLYGANGTEIDTIMNAMAAVGIGQAAPVPVPSPTPGPTPTPVPEPTPVPPPPPVPAPSGAEQCVFNATYDLWGNKAFYLHDLTSQTTPLISTRFLSDTRAAVSGNGAWAIFVTADNNIWITDGTQEEQVTSSGITRTVALSKNGRYLAYTTTTLTNQIVVVDLTLTNQTVYPLYVPIPDAANAPISYADIMSFTPGGDHLVFDGYYEGLVGGAQYGCWGIYSLRVADGTINQLVPFAEGLHIGNPSMAHTYEYYAVCDYVYESGGQTINGVLGFDFERGNAAVLFNGTPTLSQASFRGDDNKLVYRYFNANDNLYYMMDVQLAADKMSIVTNTIAWSFWNSYLSFPVGFREGAYTPPAGQFGVSATTLNFPQTIVGNTNLLTVTFTNSGNASIEILQIGLEGTGTNAYRHNGVNQRLIAGQSLPVQVRFAPGASGSHTANIRIKSTAPGASDTLIALSGQALQPTPTPTATPTATATPSPTPVPTATPTPLPTPLPGCGITVQPGQVTFRSNAQTSTVQIIINTSCTWNASASHNWISLEPPTSGTGTAYLSFTLSANTGQTSRTGFVTFGGDEGSAQVNVFQEAARKSVLTWLQLLFE